MGEGDGAGFDNDGYLSADVGVGGHAVCGGVAKLGAGYDDCGAHIGRDVGGIIET